MDTKKKIRRSRNGCHNCKRLKIKCDENKPSCSYCLKTKTDCDYSIKLTWGGRPYKDASKRKKDPYSTPITFNNESTNMPDISDGIESLSNALEKITNGGQHFHLQNSGIFNNFVLSNIDVENRENIPSPMKKSTTPMQTLVDPNNNELDEDILSNYSEDIRRIEAYLPRQSPNFLGDQRIITPEELFSTIPPSITPLPEILLQVPFYRNLMHFWVNVAADHLVPAPAHVYTDNPFKILLPQMAMEYPSILTTLLAFSAKLRSNLISSNDTPAIVTDQLLARSCNELLRLLKDKHSATADSTLATVLLLSCYEVFHSKDFDRHRAHTIGARQIIMARRRSLEKNSNDDSSHSSNTGTESDITFFLMRWFVYVDVIGALSATRNSHNYLSIKDDINAYAPAESVATINEIERLEQSVVNPKRDIDHLLGFDVKFLPHFTEIALLIRKTNNFLELNGGDSSTLPVEIITKALECKEKLMKAYEEGERRRQKKLDKIMDYKIQKKKKQTNSNSPPNLTNLIEQDNILRCTNKSFCDMGILNLYRRVLKIPRDSPLVQQLANGIGNTAKDNFASKSPADVCTIFCSFSAGCETLDEDMRQFFHDRFTKLIEMGNVNALKGLQIMTRCWQTGEDWIVASKILDIDIALL
ncbi:fungal transcriptional regulatory protein [Scheffersomyces amazonensis]|uniref:fungal transcriptional regulatory protein n=1 Tax=Scheffersomyces amazonensis TaxID=1078765 RepID=UPI00315C71F0